VARKSASLQTLAAASLRAIWATLKPAGMRTLTVCFGGTDEVLKESEDVPLDESGRLELDELTDTVDELDTVLCLVAQAANEMHSAKIKILQIIRFVINRLDVV